MATGQLPFRGESSGVIIYTSILERAPVPAARLNPDLPAKLDETANPLSGIINTNYGHGLMMARRFDEARNQLRQTLVLDPHFEVALARSADLEAYLGNYEAAKQATLLVGPDAAKLDFGSGRQGFYQAEVKFRQGFSLLDLAVAEAMLGQKHEVFRMFDAALADDAVDLITWIRRPEFDSLHGDPRYATLMRRLKLPE